MRRLSPQRGSVSVLSLVLVLMLLLGLAFAADLAGAMAIRSSQANQVAIARDSTMSGAFLMQAKNADDPGAAVAKRAAESLRENGWDGEIEVPYTAGTAWRPPGPAVQRRYHFAAGTSAEPDAVSDAALQDMPQGVQDQMAAALEEARSAQ